MLPVSGLVEEMAALLRNHRYARGQRKAEYIILVNRPDVAENAVSICRCYRTGWALPYPDGSSEARRRLRGVREDYNKASNQSIL
jgi:LPS sulfotransferase NodH